MIRTRRYHDSRRRTGISMALALTALIWSGCPQDEGFDDIELVPSPAIPTVFTVSWSSSLPEIGATAVRVTDHRGESFDVPGHAVGAGAYEAVLVGMKPAADYDWSVVMVSGDDRYASRERTLTTGAVPTGLPFLGVAQDLKQAHPDRVPQGYFVTAVTTTPPAAVIIDQDGDYVWWWAHALQQASITRVTLSIDAASVMYTTYLPPDVDDDFVGHSQLRRVSLDGTIDEDVGLPGVHHDFVELADGTIAAIAYDVREIDGQTVIGDRIVELAPDGAMTEIASVFDLFVFDPADVSSSGEWGHANAIDHDPVTDSYVVSLRTFNQLVFIDRTTGEASWRLGGADSDVSVDGSTGLFEHQHQFQLLDEGIVVFDNGSEEDLCSRAVEYRWSTDPTIADQVWTHQTSPCSYSIALGEVARLGDGDSLVTWSSQGQIDRVGADGTVVWRLSADLGGALGFSTHHDTLF